MNQISVPPIFSIVSLFSIFLISSLVCTPSFLLLAVGFFCPSSLSPFRQELGLLTRDSLSCWMSALSATNLPLSSALAASHILGYVVFLLTFSSVSFLISGMYMTHCPWPILRQVMSNFREQMVLNHVLCKKRKKVNTEKCSQTQVDIMLRHPANRGGKSVRNDVGRRVCRNMTLQISPLYVCRTASCEDLGFSVYNRFYRKLDFGGF